jgi:hypothetical protein
MHPLAGSFDNLKDSELESKIGELTKKYFMTYNTDIKSQIAMLLDSYKEEMHKRRRIALEKLMDSRDKNLDKLINIS